MQTDAQVLEQTSLFLKDHENLNKQALQLQQKRASLEKGVLICRSSFQSAITSLPEVIEIIAISSLPDEFLIPEATQLRVDTISQQQSSKSNISEIQVTEISLQSTFIGTRPWEVIRKLSVTFRQGHSQANATATDARECGLRAAHLVSQVSSQEYLCGELANEISLRLAEQHVSLAETTGQSFAAYHGVRHGEAEMNFHRRKAQEAEGKKARHEKTIKYTWMIPGVNVFTVPVALLARQKQKNISRTSQGHVETYSKYMSERQSARQQSLLDLEEGTRTLQNLSNAQALCFGIVAESRQLQDRTKIIVDEVADISGKAEEVINVLDCFQHEISSTTWRQLRRRFARSILELMHVMKRSSLHDYNTRLLIPHMETLTLMDRSAIDVPSLERPAMGS